jgi:hypothetical protein
VSFYGRGFGLTLPPRTAVRTPVAAAPTATQQMLMAPSATQQALVASRVLPAAQQYADTGAPAPESFWDQYGTLVIAGGAAVVMVGLGVMLLKRPNKVATAGYRRRRRR